MFDVEKAVAFNKKYSGRYPHPNDPQDRGSGDFAVRVCTVQKELGTWQDGKYGPTTHRLLIGQPEVYVRREGQRLRMPNRLTYRISHDRSLADVGHFSPNKNRKLKQLVWHWGGRDAEHLIAVMSGPRKVSTHFAIGLVDGEAVVYQLLDLNHRAWHAGRHNRGSVGIDICQQADPRWLGYYQQRGYIVELADNPGVGPGRALTLDPRLMVACRAFSADLMLVLGISKQMSHHQLSRRKWDISPWWDDLTS